MVELKAATVAATDGARALVKDLAAATVRNEGSLEE
jgi:hypothetical protein